MIERKGNSKGRRRKEVRNMRMLNEMRKEGKNRGEDGEIKEKKNEGWRQVTIKTGKRWKKWREKIQEIKETIKEKKAKKKIMSRRMEMRGEETFLIHQLTPSSFRPSLPLPLTRSFSPSLLNYSGPLLQHA